MMTDHIKKLRKFFIEEKGQKAFRQSPVNPFILAEQFQENDTSPLDRATERLLYVLAHEKAVVFQNERIGFTRTIPVIPEIYTDSEMTKLSNNYHIHEKGDVCNINVDYAKLLSVGFEAKKTELEKNIVDFEKRGCLDEAHLEKQQIRILNGIEALAEKYKEAAKENKNPFLARTLSQVPQAAPRNFLEALQMFRIIHFCMWCGRNYHNTIGRFDQFMYPYFKKDMDNGIYTEETALELIEEFFLTFNRDSDMYPGMQQGDNGQSMVLGGMDEEGHDQFNSLSELCLKAAYDLHVIDPKINVRVHRHTPLSTYILGTNLTKKGLGFPQYSSDDIIIPGLIKLGYSKEDAYNYVVAACWEFIVPGKGMDIPNIGALSFAGAVADATTAHLLECETYQDFQDAIDANIRGACNDLMDSTKNVFLFPAPFLSLMMDGCVEKGKDVSLGCIYNNYGFHGTGLATAADSLINIRKYIYEQKTMTKEALLMTLNDDFKNENRICNIFRYESEKMGNNDDEVDAIAAHLLDTFSNALKGHRNDRGGIFRAGTGSAMYYIWHSKDLMATADGRHKGEGIPANYSPSLFCKNIGPVSIIKSFTKSDLSKCVNGGPLTLELHDTMFRNSESIEKVATFVKSFFDLGGHQLQLNAVDRDTLLDAQKHPEKYRNLIVRVWGWSGYFVELDKCYQDHIIQRIELST